MLQKNYQAPGSILLKLATVIALTIAYLCSGCEVSKNFKANKSDTTAVKKSAVTIANTNEAAAIKTEDNRSHEENEWFRLTLKYLSEKKDGPAPYLIRGDTTINNFITQPATVIYEGGRVKRDEESKRFDSTWYATIIKTLAITTDSMNRKLDNYEKTKHSETKGLGWLTILMIGTGAIVLYKALGLDNKTS